MPTPLFDQLRERFTAVTNSLTELQQEVAGGDGNATDDQEARMRDLQTELQSLRPRLETQVDIQTQMNAAHELLSRAPAPVPFQGMPTSQDGEQQPLYRSAGAYLSDYVMARTGDSSARERLAFYMRRAAANQTTVDNPGIVPDPIVGEVINWIDTQRPIVDALGVRPLPAYPTFHRPHVTQHTSVTAQTAEKTELASRKMTIARLTITAETYGGYVDLSLQDRDFTNPDIMSILVNDLAGQYALATEAATAGDLAVGVTATTTATVGPASTPQQISTAIYEAAGKVYQSTSLMPNVVFSSVSLWGLLGPLFPPVNPTNAVASGFSAGSFEGANVNGLRFVVSPALPTNTAIVGSTQGMEVYEQRVGTLQALEVSLLGMQVGYAGFFADYLINAAAFCKLNYSAVVGTAASSKA